MDNIIWRHRIVEEIRKPVNTLPSFVMTKMTRRWRWWRRSWRRWQDNDNGENDDNYLNA